MKAWLIYTYKGGEFAVDVDDIEGVALAKDSTIVCIYPRNGGCQYTDFTTVGEAVQAMRKAELEAGRGAYPQVPSVPYTYPFGIPLSPPWVVTCQDGVATAATGTDLPTGERK